MEQKLSLIKQVIYFLLSWVLEIQIGKYVQTAYLLSVFHQCNIIYIACCVSYCIVNYVASWYSPPPGNTPRGFGHLGQRSLAHQQWQEHLLPFATPTIQDSVGGSGRREVDQYATRGQSCTRACVCVCVCARAHVRACVCICVCVIVGELFASAINYIQQL